MPLPRFHLQYSSLEPEVICRLVWVKDVEFSPTQPAPSTDTASPTTAAPFDGQVELPTCPVCLERLDEHVSGVVTTVCNHRFHNECLQRWGDTSCPVCRYGQSVSVCYSTKRCLHTSQLPRYCQHPGTTSHCTSCGTSQDVWICLICGHVGCGRYKAAHAVDHWQESGHCYALELETQRVWDYVGDGYVHRLIQSKTDGKLVAVPSPATGSHSGGGGGGSRAERCSGNDAAHGHGMDDKEWVSKGELEEALLASKLDAVAQEYNHLLVTQLESQRQYYEVRGGVGGGGCVTIHMRALSIGHAGTSTVGCGAAGSRGTGRPEQGNVRGTVTACHCPSGSGAEEKCGKETGTSRWVVGMKASSVVIDAYLTPPGGRKSCQRRAQTRVRLFAAAQHTAAVQPASTA